MPAFKRLKCVFITLSLILVWLLHSSPTSEVNAQGANDWPQLQHDVQRTGYTFQEVRAPYTYLWKWTEVPFASRTQPVVADGRLFIGALNGIMYARDAQTGAPLWSFATGGPIRHAAAVYEGRVFFGSHDSYIYALDAANGVEVWRYKTGAGIATAPLVANDTVYIGSTDGVFYAVDTSTGSLRWSYDVGAPILTSAALSTDGNTVYFGAEDITAYALNASSGALRWKTRLQGQSLADRWPVVVGSSVIYRSQSLHYFHDLLHDGDDVMDQAGSVSSSWSADWAKVRPYIISHLTNHPDQQTFFVLDAMNGALRGPAPVLYTYGNGDAPAPPVVRGEEVYLLYRARHGIQTDGGSVHVTTRYDAELGRMDLETLDIVGLTLAPGEDWHLQFRATSDEPAMLSMGGSMLFVDNWTRLGGVDVDTGELFEVANVADYWPECNANCVGKSGPMPYFDSYPFPGPRVAEGRVHRPAVIANGIIYWRVIEGGLAAIGHSSGSGQGQPLVWSQMDEVSNVSTAQSDFPDVSAAALPPLSYYVWTLPTRPVPNPPADLVSRLESEVQAMVNAGHLAPFFIERGFTTPEGIPGDSSKPEEGLVSFGPHGNVYWFDPGELIYTLSLAYPYLSSGLQSQVRTYLQDEMVTYPPLQPLPWEPTWLTAGTRRERYSLTVNLNVWPPPAPPLSTLYALWAYAYATGDWAYLQNHWPEIDALFDDKKDEVDSYADISGAIGYARIADHLGYSSAAQEGETVAVAGMVAGKDFTTFLNTANNRYPDNRGEKNGYRAPVFFGLVPEVGWYLRDHVGGAVSEYLRSFTDYYDGDYLWYLTRLGVQKEPGESSFHGPELAWSIFLAEAYTQDVQRSELRCYLDRPWGLGDLYSLQKLVATIEATDHPNLSSSSKVPSHPAPRQGEIVTYTITLRNTGSVLTTTTRVTDVIPPQLAFRGLEASLGVAYYQSGAVVWNGVLSDATTAQITYTVTVLPASPSVIENTAVIDAGWLGTFERSATIIANGYRVFLPLVMR